MTNTGQLCHCGKPLHYPTAGAKRRVDKLIEQYGDHVYLIYRGRLWKVQRHYYELHMPKAADLHRLGFEEVTGEDIRVGGC